MSQLFETIKIENSRISNIEYHNERLNRSRRELFGSKDRIDLQNLIVIPENMQSRVAKCRVVYDMVIRKIEFYPYAPKEIKSLKLIECNDIDYSFKYEERSKLNELFEQRGDTDDILIVKNGFITDTSIANIVLFDGEKWVTSSTPLLPGTQRTKLLKEGVIIEQEIRLADLGRFKKLIVVNAMLEFDPENYISIERINF